MTTWVTSDIHLMHTNIIKYQPESRGQFADAVEMTEYIIQNWNNTVRPNDEVWILGDVSMGPKELHAVNIGRLRGQKKLILGNHDYRINSDKEGTLRPLFAFVDMYKEIQFGGLKICMMHYPIAHWAEMERGALMLHGHLHGSESGVPGRIKDVGMDTNNLNLYNLEELVTQMKEIPVARGHHDNKEFPL